MTIQNSRLQDDDQDVDAPVSRNWNLIMIAFLIGSAALLTGASLWVLVRFSPQTLMLGRAHPQAPAITPSATPATDPAAMSTAVLSPLPTALPSAGSPRPRVTTASPSSAPPSRNWAPTMTLVGLPHPVTDPTLTQSPTMTATATSSAPAPAPDPDTLPVNAPGASVQITSIGIGSTADSTRTVTLTGVGPANQTTAPSQTFIDWGDGTGRSMMSTADNPVPAAGYTLIHAYAADGTYTINWGYTSDRDHVWIHAVTVAPSTTAVSAPAQSLTSLGTDGQIEHFGFSDPYLTPWSQWTLNYGDGSYSAGTDATRPTATESQHLYDGTGHLAILTVVGPDGQLTTSTLATP